MTDQTPIEPPGGAPPPANAPWYSVESAAALADERPEVALGAAFVAGFLLARILRRLGR